MLGTSLSEARYNRSYTTGRIIQIGATSSRGDNLSLIASSLSSLYNMLLESDNTYFIRGNLVESATGLNFAGSLVINASSTCYDGTAGATVCPDLVVDALGSETTANNALTAAQIQSVPADPAVPDGLSPAMGDAYLYAGRLVSPRLPPGSHHLH